jgi:hypothetical protein
VGLVTVYVLLEVETSGVDTALMAMCLRVAFACVAGRTRLQAALRSMWGDAVRDLMSPNPRTLSEIAETSQ